MQDMTPTMNSAILGRELKRWAHDKGLWASEVARLLDVSPSKVSRLFSGKRGVNVADIGGLAALAGVPDSVRAAALELADRFYEQVWVRNYSTPVPEQAAAVLTGEETAQTVTAFHPSLVPDLLQVSGYTRELLAGAPSMTPDDIDTVVQQRAARKQVLNPFNGPWEDTYQQDNIPDDDLACTTPRADADRSRPARFTFFVSDSAFLPPSGVSREVLSDQLHYLLRISVLPTVTLRVLPANADLWWKSCPPFELFKFDNQKPAVCMTNLSAVTVLENDANVRFHHAAVESLKLAAFDTVNSRRILTKRAAHVSTQDASWSGE